MRRMEFFRVRPLCSGRDFCLCGRDLQVRSSSAKSGSEPPEYEHSSEKLSEKLSSIGNAVEKVDKNSFFKWIMKLF